MSPLEIEIVKVLRRGPKSLLGLEDNTNLWRTPKQLRQELGALIVEGVVRQDFNVVGAFYRLTDLGEGRAADLLATA